MLAKTTIARAHADDAVALCEHILTGETGEHVHALGFDLSGEPPHERVERDDEVAMIPQWRRDDRKRQTARLREEVDTIAAHLGGKRRAFLDESRESARAAPTGRERRRTEHAHRRRALFRAPRSTWRSPPCCFCSCASRSAADRPAGPPPTIRTSTSRVSRSIADQPRRHEDHQGTVTLL